MADGGGTGTSSPASDDGIKGVMTENLLDQLRAVYEEQVKRAGAATTQTKFDLACALVRSMEHHHIAEGCALLEELLAEDESWARDFHYFLSYGNYRLGNYPVAREHVDAILDNEPNNRQALSLRALIDDSTVKDGITGMAIVGGLAAAVGIIGYLVAKKR